jgi:two-component system LytT family response regulator
MRVLIADDEEPARRKLRRLLSTAPDVEIVGEAATGEDAVRMIRSAAPDLVFLDVQMPALDGFGVIDRVGVGTVPAVIFVTAHDAHAVRAFEVAALDYLLKPFSANRFAAVLDRARLAVARGATRRWLLVSDAHQALPIPLDQVISFEADRNYVRVHVGDRTFGVRGTLAALVSRLDPADFLRINRSEVVRLAMVRAVHPRAHGDRDVELADGRTLIWSRRYRPLGERRLGVPR